MKIRTIWYVIFLIALTAVIMEFAGIYLVIVSAITGVLLGSAAFSTFYMVTFREEASRWWYAALVLFLEPVWLSCGTWTRICVFASALVASAVTHIAWVIAARNRGIGGSIGRACSTPFGGFNP